MKDDLEKQAQKRDKLAKVFPSAPPSGKFIPPPEKPSLTEVIPDPLPRKPPPKYLSGDNSEIPEEVKNVKTTRDLAFPSNDPQQLPPLKRHKKADVSPTYAEEEKQDVPMHVPDDEERFLVMKRRELEKKRLLKEEMELDRALMKPASEQMLEPHPRKFQEDKKPEKSWRYDPLYMQQLNDVKKKMLMDAIFGPKV